MHWVDRGAYVHDRGWYAVAETPGWVSPHDGLLYSLEDAATFEMLREFEGNPTPRRGLHIDPIRGEIKSE